MRQEFQPRTTSTPEAMAKTGRGKLILIEGLDRSGKSTQSALLQRQLPNCELLKFPDRSTRVGSLINDYLTGKTQLSDQSAHLLFSANRWELAKSIEEKLLQGKFIVLDRYIYSGIAYSLAKLLSNDESSPEMKSVEWLYSPDKGLPKPDLTLFLSLPTEELARRKGWGEERYEDVEFQKKVRECFLRVLQDIPQDHLEIINVSDLSIEQVKSHIWEVIELKELNKLTTMPLDKLH